jgi:hypothetical protein
VYGGGDSLDDCEGMSAGGEYHKNGQLLVGGVTLFKKKEHPVRILDSKGRLPALRLTPSLKPDFIPRVKPERYDEHYASEPVS